MLTQHLKTARLWIFSGGLILTLAGGTVAAEPQAEEKKEVQEDNPAKDPLRLLTVSKETTRFTEPLKPDGTVDFAAAINAHLGRGVTPENNAGVLLMQGFGANVVPEEHREGFFKDLGMAVPALEGQLKNISQFAEQRLTAEGKADDINKLRPAYFEQQSKAMNGPWSRKDLPLIADWLDANTEALKLATLASQKPRLFLPVIRGDKDPILDMNFELLQNMRVFSRLLTARAMLALEEGRIEEAQADLLAGHRLAGLMSHQPMVIQVLVAYALDAMACQGNHAFAQSEKVTPEQLAAYRQKLLELPPLAKMSDTLDQGERFVSLDAICHMATHLDDESAQAIGIPKVWRRLLGLSVDWDLILKRFNEQYDEMVIALKAPSHAERVAEIGKMEDELRKLREEANQPAQFALMFLGVNPPRAMVSRQMGNVLLQLMMPAVLQAATAETRTQNRRDMAILAVALAEHHREHGNYPEALTDLSPKNLESLPRDRFNDKPFKYQKQKTGYLLYSVGANGKDDQGQGYSPDNDTDDIAIRVPSEPAS